MAPIFEPAIRVHPGRRQFSNYWESFAPKLGRRVSLNSDLEYFHWLSLEGTPEVQAYCEQPLKVSIVHDNKTYTSIFDFWVKWSSGKEEFHETKYISELNDPRCIRQLETQKMWCSVNARNHRVVTDAEILPRMTWLMNWRQMLGYIVMNQPSLVIQENVLDVVGNLPRTIQWIEGRLGSSCDLRAEIFRLIHLGKLDAMQLSQRSLSISTQVQIRREDHR
jgi:hypothetical protein